MTKHLTKGKKSKKPLSFEWGIRPKKFAYKTDKCKVWVTTLAGINIPGLKYRTPHSAEVTLKALWPLLLKAYGSFLWRKLWEDFKCPPKKCPNKEARKATPIWVKVSWTKVKNRAGKDRFQIYVELAREIQCLPEGDGKDKSVKLPRKLTQKPPPKPKPPPKRTPDSPEWPRVY